MDLLTNQYFNLESFKLREINLSDCFHMKNYFFKIALINKHEIKIIQVLEFDGYIFNY